MNETAPEISPKDVETLRQRLASMSPEATPQAQTPQGQTPQELWDAISPADWPALFHLLDVAAGLPRDGDAEPSRLQTLVDHPAVPDAATIVASRDIVTDGARRELESRHCVHVDGLVDAAVRRTVEAEARRLGEVREAAGDDAWGEVDRDDAPELFAAFDRAVASERFRRLTGYDSSRDTYSLTLSLQSLDTAGIGWHRDLYWPREWVGEDVFAVLYGLDDDVPEKGGAFLYYVPWENALYAAYRQRHQATILWNARETEGRILHAVSGYHGEDTARHLVILQCLRRSDDSYDRRLVEQRRHEPRESFEDVARSLEDRL